MSADVCDHYQQHTWRKDTCANCLKPRKLHGPCANPQPAKRLSKTAPTRGEESSTVLDRDDAQAIDEGPMENQLENSQVRGRQPSGPDTKRLSVVGSPKPAPIKAKPLIVSKPEKAKKPGVTDCGERIGTVKKTAEESISQNVSCTSDVTTREATSLKQDVRTTTGTNHSEVSDVNLDREPVNTAQKTTKARARPQVTPPQVPDPSRIPNTTSNKSSSSMAKTTDVKTSVKPKSSSLDALDPGTKKHPTSSDPKEKSSGSHYYQIYDISAKGLSGTPEPVDVSEQNGVVAKGTRGACRVVDVVDEPQNVAMPYTVVDVTVCQPNKDQLLSKAPPQLPLTPAPIRDGGAASVAQNNTMPTSRPWSTREGIDPQRHTTPKTTHDLSRTGLSNPLSSDSCPSETSSVRGTAVLPLDGRFLVGKMATQDLYEDIGGNNASDKHSSSSNLSSEMNPTLSTTVAKSAALEAKMAALSKLDFNRAVAPSQATSTLPARMDDARHDPLVAAGVDRQDLGEADETKSGEIATVVTLNRQEKGRKSGSKSFFQKFLKRGNKETTAEVPPPQGRSSSLNISIEPILNATPSSVLGQSSQEVMTSKTSISVGSDSLVSSSSSPTKITLNKPLLPISPAKKPLPSIDISEGGDSSGDSSVSSLEESGKLPDKASFEQPCEKSLAADKGEGESISCDLPKVPPVKPSIDRTMQSSKSPGIVLNDDAPTEIVINQTRESFTAARDKLKSCSSLSRIPDGTKPVEDRMSFAESLRDALALKISERDAAAAAAAGKDAVLDANPTAADGTEQALSGKCTAQKDVPKPSKAPRKMMAPPPMAPPPPPPPSLSAKDQDGTGSSSSPRHAAYMAAETELPSGSAALTYPLSNTLPRKSSSTSSSANSTGLKIAAGTIGLRQLDSAAKHARNKTVSEGVRFEKLLIAPQEGEEKKQSEDAMVASETLERRASKFLNRALPAPPPKESSSDGENCLDEIDNLYERVSQSVDPPAKDKNLHVDDEQLTYEDIDLYCSKANNGSKASSTSSSQRSTSVQATNAKQATNSSDPSAPPCSSYYLEPVGGKEENADMRGRGGVKDDWRPCPAPRGSHLLKAGHEQTAAAMPYVNTRMINGQLPLNTSDGFDAMAGLIVNMLYHLTDRLYTSYVTRFLKNRSDVFWTDFELLDFTARIVLEKASFYQAKHLVLAPSGCILMVARESQGSSFSLEPTHANVISPLLCFAMSASDLETLNGSTTDETPMTVPRNATVAVLLCSDVATLDSFWEREHAKVLDESTTIVFEQSICLCLVQVLNALLYLRDSGCTVLRLSSEDVIMTLTSDSKWHPLVKPSVMTFDVCSDHDSAFLGEDVTQLLFQMLRTDLGKPDRQEARVVTPRTRYSRGLQRVLRTLVAPRTWEGLETGRNLLEFVLWGPSEEEAKFVAMTDTRETSFRVWLEVARCRMASALVLELERHNLELANQAKFLCRVTENSLLGVTKLLFE